MTKTKTATEMLEEIAAAPTDDELARARARDDYYMRDTALGYAMNYHKNNGGMLPIAQIVDHANVFLNFLKGETK